MTNKWTRTSEKLPELIKYKNSPMKMSQSVIVVDNNGEVYDDMYFCEVSGEQYFENIYGHPVQIKVSDVKFWMYGLKAPKLRTECLNCKIKDTCKFAYDNVCGGNDPCLICIYCNTISFKEPCSLCNITEGCKWCCKDWSEE